MRIAFFELEAFEKKEAKEKFKKHKLSFSNKELSKKNVESVKNAEIIVVFIYSSVSREIIDKFDNLKCVVTMSTGFDHIDVNYCKKRKIDVVNIPTYGENTVAEHTFSLILALSRKLYPSIKRTHLEHSFETDKTLRGFDLKGKTLGVIGCGNIGKHVARIGVGFEMEVLVYDLTRDKGLERKIGFKYASLDKVLRCSDVISLHLPYNKKTRHLIDAVAIGKMKKGVVLINTARGGIVDTHSLIKGLKSGKINGAGLDVIEEECDIKEEREILKDKFKSECNLHIILENHLLMKMNNVIMTPHNAFNSHEAIRRILDTTFKNISSCISGRVRNMVY